MGKWWMGVLIFCVASACQSEEYPKPIPGTLHRIGQPTPAPESEITVHILSSKKECDIAQVRETEECIPRIDRTSGEVRLAFELKDPQSRDPVYRALKPEQVSVKHDLTGGLTTDLKSFDRVSTGQLYILLIDGSGSMFENDARRMRKVWEALMSPKVIEGFYPEGNNNTAVVLMRFYGDQVVGLDNKSRPTVLKRARDYEKMLKDHLMVRTGGYTNLYQAVKYSVTDLLEKKPIKDFLNSKDSPPTIVLLTDGFNNVRASDICRDNVTRLQTALDTIRTARDESIISRRPTIYSVGLGKKYRKKDYTPGLNKKVTATQLCGKKANERIDGDLERTGIDHVSLQWIAERGGGQAFVKSKPKELADVFRQTAASRHRWHQVSYRVQDNWWFRKSFDVEVKLIGMDRAFSSVTMYPGPWFGGPPGIREPGKAWAENSRLASISVLVMPILGFLLVFSMLGAATFNARRAIFRRAPPGNRKKNQGSQVKKTKDEKTS